MDTQINQSNDRSAGINSDQENPSVSQNLWLDSQSAESQTLTTTASSDSQVSAPAASPFQTSDSPIDSSTPTPAPNPASAQPSDNPFLPSTATATSNGTDTSPPINNHASDSGTTSSSDASQVDLISNVDAKVKADMKTGNLTAAEKDYQAAIDAADSQANDARNQVPVSTLLQILKDGSYEGQPLSAADRYQVHLLLFGEFYAQDQAIELRYSYANFLAQNKQFATAEHIFKDAITKADALPVSDMHNELNLLNSDLLNVGAEYDSSQLTQLNTAAIALGGQSASHTDGIINDSIAARENLAAFYLGIQGSDSTPGKSGILKADLAQSTIQDTMKKYTAMGYTDPTSDPVINFLASTTNPLVSSKLQIQLRSDTADATEGLRSLAATGAGIAAGTLVLALMDPEGAGAFVSDGNLFAIKPIAGIVSGTVAVSAAGFTQVGLDHAAGVNKPAWESFIAGNGGLVAAVASVSTGSFIERFFQYSASGSQVIASVADRTGATDLTIGDLISQTPKLEQSIQTYGRLNLLSQEELNNIKLVENGKMVLSPEGSIIADDLLPQSSFNANVIQKLGKLKPIVSSPESETSGLGPEPVTSQGPMPVGSSTGDVLSAPGSFTSRSRLDIQLRKFAIAYSNSLVLSIPLQLQHLGDLDSNGKPFSFWQTVWGTSLYNNPLFIAATLTPFSGPSGEAPLVRSPSLFKNTFRASGEVIGFGVFNSGFGLFDLPSIYQDNSLLNKNAQPLQNSPSDQAKHS